jgi:hypothetical protein
MTRLDAVNYIAHGISKRDWVPPPPTLQPDYEYFSCLISYSHNDKKFCKRLYKKMREYKIPCWMDDHQLLPGDDIIEQIEKGIREYDKVLVICSEHSLNSGWVEIEIEKAIQKEERLRKDKQEKVFIIIPLNLDGYLFKWANGKASILRARLAADFIGWEKNWRKFNAQVERIATALRADQEAREKPPSPKL